MKSIKIMLAGIMLAVTGALTLMFYIAGLAVFIYGIFKKEDK